MKTIDQSNILFAGPMPPPVTGQSFAFLETISVVNCKKKYVIDQNFEGQNVFRKYVKTIALFPRYLGLFLFRKIDLVYFTGTRSFQGSVKDLILILLCLTFRKKMINHIHGGDFKYFINSLPRVYQLLLFFAYRRINTHIILLDKMRFEMNGLLEDRNIKVIPNFYDPLLDSLPLKQKSDRELVICYFSNLMYSKGILDVVEAFNGLDTTTFNVRLLLAGKYLSDEYMSAREVEEKVNNTIEKNNRIEFCGLLNGQQKASLLSSSHIFVLPSFYRSEAFPISVIEAMRCGCVIICADHNYMKDIIKPQNGSLVEARDAAGLRKELFRYLSNPSLMKTISEYNCNYAKLNFSVASYKLKINSLFQSTLHS